MTRKVSRINKSMLEKYGMSVLVTGGLGLIGSNMCDILVENGESVYAVDNMYRGKLEYLKYPHKVTVLEKDIIDLTEDDVIKDCEIVYHGASKVLGIGYSARNQQDMLFHNDNMTNAFFDYIGRFDKLKELVVISSSCVYDDNLPATPEHLGFEGQPETANLGYGIAKRFLEQKSILWCAENDIKLTIIRPFNIYGERYTWAGAFSQGLPSLVKKLLDDNGTLEIWGSGSQRRNYMHAYDCARLIIDIAKRNPKKCDTFNLGIEETVSLRELAEMMCALYGITPRFSYRTDMPEGRLVKSAEETKLRNIIPEFKANLISLEDGLKRMESWYHSSFQEVD